MKNAFLNYIGELQNSITSSIEKVDGSAKFKVDEWKRPEGGGGKTKIIENGNVFEKAGVNTSAVHGQLPKSMQDYFKTKNSNFFACGLSLVFHPKNPMVPTVHANWRYFELYSLKGKIKDQWFGGGLDLTPYYLFKDDAKHFHKVCKDVCDVHGKELYKKFKDKCDSYFWNSHRKEARGIGGLFFDYLRSENNKNMEDWFLFITDVGDSFLNAYLPIVNLRKNHNYSSSNRIWQEIRRARYAEFNLVHDKGTLFGLKTNGRTESIFISLPPTARWKYNYIPKQNSEEEKLIKILKSPIEWVK
ncbi:MAG: oxygen-dependent coproporphyrinogen oxidase [Flavobacteriaceae bacterium]|nr:oxygen-dependent coproporphyrinogen oxidase [Flavobacteriaceae bacterium]